LFLNVLFCFVLCFVFISSFQEFAGNAEDDEAVAVFLEAQSAAPRSMEAAASALNADVGAAPALVAALSDAARLALLAALGK
jgi:hypothetical protein